MVWEGYIGTVEDRKVLEVWIISDRRPQTSLKEGYDA